MKKHVVKVLVFSLKKEQLAIKTANSSWIVNNPMELAREIEINSQELLLAKLASSLHTTAQLIGTTLNLDLKSIQIEVLGEVGLTDTQSVTAQSFTKIDVIVKPTSEASIILLKEWMDAIKIACPVFTNFKSVTPTVLTLVKEYDKINAA